jgi:ABC-type Fe3+/spermidine/putrescine transport system ATPase subunit
VAIALRPERLSLYDLNESVPDGQNKLRVRVTRRMYYGDVYFYDVDAGLGAEIEVKEENRPGVELWEVGDEAHLVWSPKAANLVTA